MRKPVVALAAHTAARRPLGVPVPIARHQFALAAVLALAGTGLSGTTVLGTTTDAVWTGGAGTDTDWSNGYNWVQGQSPDGSGSSIVEFAGTTSLAPNNDYGTYTQFKQVLFDSGAGSFTLYGNVIKLYAASGDTAKIENNSTTAQTVNFNTSGRAILSESNMELDPTQGDLTINNGVYADNGGGVFFVYGNTGHTLTLNAGIGQFNTTASLVNQSDNRIVITAASTYTGGTTLNAGKLFANNGTTGSATGSGGIAVNSTATLSGSGTIGNGTNAILVNGTITAGANEATIGTLTTGSQSWNTSGGAYTAKIASTDGSTVSGNDELVMSGVTLIPGGKFAIDLPGLSSNPATPTLLPSVKLVLAYDQATSTNPFSANAATLATEFTLSAPGLKAASGYQLQLDSQPASGGGYDLVVDSVSAAPEPGSLMLLGLATAPVLVGGRRRRG